MGNTCTIAMASSSSYSGSASYSGSCSGSSGSGVKNSFTVDELHQILHIQKIKAKYGRRLNFLFTAGRKNLAEVFDMFDKAADSKGYVTAEQYMDIWKKLGKRKKRDKLYKPAINMMDGHIAMFTRNEKNARKIKVNEIFMTMVYAWPVPVREAQEVAFLAADADRNGELSKKEMNRYASHLFDGLSWWVKDAAAHSGNYGLSKKDAKFLKKEKKELLRLFDPSQAPAIVKAVFKEADVNDDGTVDHDEWTNWQQDGSFATTWSTMGLLFEFAALAFDDGSD